MKSTKLARFLNQFYDGKKCAASVKIGEWGREEAAGHLRGQARSKQQGARWHRAVGEDVCEGGGRVS